MAPAGGSDRVLPYISTGSIFARETIDDDATLNGCKISDLEQADNIAQFLIDYNCLGRIIDSLSDTLTYMCMIPHNRIWHHVCFKTSQHFHKLSITPKHLYLDTQTLGILVQLR